MNENLSKLLESSINNAAKEYKKVIFVCIGTDRSTGGCYGPMVGTFLKRQGFNVYGTIENPVHALNMELILKNIDMKNNLIIAVDACIGEDIGDVKICDSPVYPGKGAGKNLPKVGDVSIKGIFANTFINIDFVRLNTVFNLAKITTEAICNVFLKEYQPIESLI